MTHTGKIGRLPKDLRNEVAHRIEAGERGKDIVNWLNTQPEVCQIHRQLSQLRGIPTTPCSTVQSLTPT
jgi:hypothetical protein